MLTDAQKRRAIEAMHEYLKAKNPDGTTPLELSQQTDANRVTAIRDLFGPLLTKYLASEIVLGEFKSTNDGLNKKHGYWGFKGIKGQMFFNLLAKVCEDDRDLDAELKTALPVPASEDAARSRIKTFAAFVRRVGDDFVENGGSKHGKPKPSSIPFFLSFFWQLQERDTWPVYYTNSVNAATDMNLWQATGDLAEDYISYKHLHEELAEVFSEASGRTFGLYDVEQVFWFTDGNPFGEATPSKPAVKSKIDVVDDDKSTSEEAPIHPAAKLDRLPDSYVPPIVAILPRMARNDADLDQAAAASGTTLARAFEKHIDAAFTIMGYDTTLLGQGQGRVPDGKATEHDASYVILWDGKVRGKGYAVGTDDRTIRDYIDTQCREIKRRRTIRNVYYAIISSEFADDHDDTVRSLKMETDVSEVVFIEAAALVEMVEAKLRDPQQITLGPDGMQRLFSTSGILTASYVAECLM